MTYAIARESPRAGAARVFGERLSAVMITRGVSSRALAVRLRTDTYSGLPPAEEWDTVTLCGITTKIANPLTGSVIVRGWDRRFAAAADKPAVTCEQCLWVIGQRAKAAVA